MSNVGIFFFPNKVLIVSTEGGSVYCQQMLLPENINMFGARFAFSALFQHLLFYLLQKHLPAASCVSNFPSGQLSLASGRNI